jgi:hypothetical protein
MPRHPGCSASGDVPFLHNRNYRSPRAQSAANPCPAGSRRPYCGPMQHSPRAALPFLVRRLIRRHYRLIAAALLCAAAGLTVHELTPAPLETVPVVTAAADLAAGTILADSDLVTGRLPASAVPSGSAASAHDLTGKRLATALRAGSPVLDTSIVGPGLLAGSPPGTVAVPVRPADQSTVQLLSPGQRVDRAQHRQRL